MQLWKDKRIRILFIYSQYYSKKRDFLVFKRETVEKKYFYKNNDRTICGFFF